MQGLGGRIQRCKFQRFGFLEPGLKGFKPGVETGFSVKYDSMKDHFKSIVGPGIHEKENSVQQESKKGFRDSARKGVQGCRSELQVQQLAS